MTARSCLYSIEASLQEAPEDTLHLQHFTLAVFSIACQHLAMLKLLLAPSSTAEVCSSVSIREIAIISPVTDLTGPPVLHGDRCFGNSAVSQHFFPPPLAPS